jgi:ketosteroid isomerase-like protein
MGPCRGSGVLEKQADGQWKLAHYNLAVLVPNEKIKNYKKLIGKK